MKCSGMYFVVASRSVKPGDQLVVSLGKDDLALTRAGTGCTRDISWGVKLIDVPETMPVCDRCLSSLPLAMVQRVDRV